MNRRFCLLLCVVVLVVIFSIWGYKVYFFRNDEETKIWTTTRVLPEQVDLSAYLSGNIARQSEDIDQAVQSYLTVLKTDPDNHNLIYDTYILSMFQGTPEFIVPYLDILLKEKNALMADYLQIAHWIHQGNTQQAQQLLKHKKQHPVDSLLSPLLQSWIYVKQGHRSKAIKALEVLSDNSKYTFIYGYQTFLLGNYLNDPILQQKGVEIIKDKRLLAIGFFPLLKKYIETQEKWSDSNLFHQYSKMDKNYPASAEMITQMAETNLTIETGLAEAFYLASLEMATQNTNKEVALFLNSIALYLHPKKTLAQIWGAELTNNLKMPKVSLIYSNRLPTTSATLMFKKATLLVALNQNQKALEILEKLKPQNLSNIPLHTLMAQVYTNMNKTDKAIKTYTYLIDKLSSKMENKALAKIYMNRASLLYQENQIQKMLDDLEKANVLTPDNPMIQNDLGYNKLLNNQMEDGFRLVQQAYKQNPENPYILDSMSFAYMKKNQFQTALPFAEKAVDIMPQSALIHLHLGDIYFGLGRKREAKFQYKQALDLKTDLNPTAIKQAQQKLNTH